jgi:erythronate-4-phosphate dehydrogenase
MNIIADSNIPCVEEAFSAFGRVAPVSGREIRRDILTDAEMLLVRSVTKVNRELIENTPIKFVGTTTIGTDHIDMEYLKSRGIGFAAAPGSNACSVAQYVVCALATISRSLALDLRGNVMGIIGAGNVGSRVAPLAQTLGMRCLFNDPPLQKTRGKGFASLEETLASADVISMHVPLSAAGLYPTLHMADELFFDTMKPGALFINTSRGSVVSEEALRTRRKKLAGVILDVWENEPSINKSTMAMADIATPHIAGHSFDGKINGTYMIYAAACDYFHRAMTWTPDIAGHPVANTIDARASSDPFFHALQSAYPLMDDDRLLREIAVKQNGPAYFDHLRNTYRKRYEFRHYTVLYSPQQSGEADALKRLGFNVQETHP